MTTTKQRAYLPTDTFSYENGLNMAVAFTAYDNDEAYLLDPSYGEIIFNQYTWGEGADGNVWLEYNKIESAVCTDEQLGLAEGRTGAEFLKVAPDNLNQLKKFRKKFICPKKEEMKIRGTFNSNEASLIEVELVKCRDKPDCVTNDEIMEYF